jgi:hypothetical protein
MSLFAGWSTRFGNSNSLQPRAISALSWLVASHGQRRASKADCPGSVPGGV